MSEAKALPPVVADDEWQRERDALLVEEKQATRLLDALAAKRRRLPMVAWRNDYVFEGPDGPATLLELFGEHPQLAVYQFMDLGPERFCPGCTRFTDNVTYLDGLADGGVAWATVSDMPLAQIESYKAERGWTMPFYSSRGTTFSADCGVGGGFMLSSFLRDGDNVYRTYSTTSRGVDRLMFGHNILDLAPYGRQEAWEDSPPGWPQEQS
jgi:predicted dithiol-disulfide oxidoreductase (DUF899 family)